MANPKILEKAKRLVLFTHSTLEDVFHDLKDVVKLFVISESARQFDRLS